MVLKNLVEYAREDELSNIHGILRKLAEIVGEETNKSDELRNWKVAKKILSRDKYLKSMDMVNKEVQGHVYERKVVWRKYFTDAIELEKEAYAWTFEHIAYFVYQRYEENARKLKRTKK